MSARKVQCDIHSGPDRRGRYFVTFAWEDTAGEYRPQLSKADSRPVGYRRGQVFNCTPDNHRGPFLRAFNRALKARQP